MTYKLLIPIGLIILGFVLFFMAGCATSKASAEHISVKVQVDPNKLGCYVIAVDANDIEVEFSTLGKDVNIGKDFMSTVSPENQGILEAISGFVAGLVVSGT